ncbi:hypothetical protein [Sphingobacterium sp. UBA1498]|uniref:hypothetical protein n=1 Tax=Sphingobacterium sp. UBA1498 TaxID=1947481 RepID=UPI0039C99FFE
MLYELILLTTDFNRQRGASTVEEADFRIAKYAMVEEDGVTGKFISEEHNPDTGETPW